MKPFSDILLEYTKDFESPTSFWKWSGYAIIAGLLRDNVWLKQADIRIYPNIYVVLMADSGAHRKNRPVSTAGDLAQFVKITKVIRGRASIQAILSVLGKVYTDRNTGEMIKGGSCLLCAEELASFIVDDPQAIKLLTDIYDYREVWESILKSEEFKVEKLCVSMLAASNEEFLRDVYTGKAIYGGLLARTFLIKPDEFRRGNSLFETNGSYNRDVLLDPIKDIIDKKNHGEVLMSAEGAIEYNRWYYPFRESYRVKPDRSGVAARIHTGVLKLSMILTLDRYERIIRKDIVERAICECMELLPNYENFTMGSGKSEIAEAAAFFLQSLWEAKGHTMYKSDFLAKHWNEVDGEKLNKITETLEQGKIITILISGAATIYTLTSKGIEAFKK